MKKERNYDIGSEYLGKYVIIRTYSAGVHMGKVKDIYENRVILEDSRRMRFFKNIDDGDSLSHIAARGIHPDSKITMAIDNIMLEWVEVIPLTDEAKLTFDALPYEVVE